jgi:diguanylate cyclase (GGDEF)-like protein
VRPTALNSVPVAMSLAVVAAVVLTQSAMSYHLSGYPAYTNRRLGPVVEVAFIIGLPLALLIGAAACVFALRQWRPGLGMVVIALVVTSWASITTGDHSAAPGFVLLYILLVGAYQLRPAGAWVTCLLATLTAGLSAWVPLGATYAARTVVTFGLLGATMTYLMTVARDRNEHLIRQLRERVYRDPVSGVGSRLLFEEEAARHLRGGAVAENGTALLLVDLDHFKTVNDQHGHLTGDRLLRHVAQGLSAGARPDDIVCRLGGDELAVLMPATTIDEATGQARSTVAALRGRPLPLPGGGSLPFTLSVGVGHCVSGTLDDLYAEADEALYRAKGAGRATIGVRPPTDPESAPNPGVEPDWGPS